MNMGKAGAALMTLLFAFGSDAYAARAAQVSQQSATVIPVSMVKKYEEFKKPPKDELKKKLSPTEFKVTQEEGTEAPFNNPLWNEKREGIYVDRVSGEPLFSSKTKFDSGTGWPSFWAPIDKRFITTKTDRSLFEERTEVRSRYADSHLGHVFEDGPKPTGLRYCMNSAAMRFIPVEDMKKEGYEELLTLFDPGHKPGERPGEKATGAAATEKATLAGGCFWGMEEILRAIPGVISTQVGYTGGFTPDPVYEKVKTGETGHAESIEVVFDPRKITYEKILEYFFRMHDPTTRNRQGNDIGTQYRSAIFYHTDEQKKVAEAVKAKVESSGKWKKPLVTEIVAASKFYDAEAYHQDYLQKNPGGYTCHFLRD